MSIEVKSKNLTLSLGVSKKVADVIVSLSVPFKGMASCCLNRLKKSCGNPSPLMNGSEESALAFALFEAIRDKLEGSGLEIMSTKSTNVDCHNINNNLVFTWHTQGSITAIRKSTGIAISCLNPTKLFSKYSENIKFLTGKNGDKEVFNFVAKKLSKEIKSHITITVVGKVNATKEKVSDVVKVLDKKFPEIEMPTDKESSQPQKHKSEEVEMEYPFIKCSGVAAAIVSDYIRNNSNGMSVSITEEGVTIYNSNWSSKQKQLSDKKRISDYINKKYLKIEEKGELSNIFAYFALSQGYIDSTIAKSIIASKLKVSKLIELIEKAF
jgi:hypothetical protein